MTLHKTLAVVAAFTSAVAVYLPTRTQAFTRVALDGRNIRMLLAGNGDTTVVFEGGSSASLELWAKVQPLVSRFARTVSYDRAGMGLSDPGLLPRDGRRIATELREALRAASVAPPLVMVGASLGGPFVKIFADRYPDDVSAIVLVDPTPESTQFANAQGSPEFEAWPNTREQARAAHLPNVPVLLIDAVSPVDVPFADASVRRRRSDNRVEIEAESREFASWLATIPKGRLITTHQSGHNVAVEQPDLVVETIRKAIAGQ